MKLKSISIENYRSIIKFEEAIIPQMLALVGENNAGKSNILNAINVFLSAGSGGINETDFNNIEEPIIITCKFEVNSIGLKKIWKPYMINDDLILEKHIWIEKDTNENIIGIKNEFHGYQAEPRDWYLSIKKIKEKLGDRPKWKDIVTENNLPDYFLKESTCNKEIYTQGVAKYINENDVVYDNPDISETQALGFQSKAVSNLPRFYLLSSSANYTDETDRRSSTSTFRMLMSDLTDRIIKKDEKYSKIEEALKTVNDLLNENKDEDNNDTRLPALSSIEDKIKELLTKIMPSVERVKLKVNTEDVSTIFSKGVELKINDGVETDVTLKGHGLQRCVIFTLLQALILNSRRELVSGDEVVTEDHPIILAIEEPELYIHPQLGKLFYDVLKAFSERDQVIYTTHSPRFIDVYEYESIAIIKKDKIKGTQLSNCNLRAFEGLTDKKVFRGLTQLNSDVNEMFFARKVIVVEGPEDKIAVTETAKKLQKIDVRPEEIDTTIIVAGGKPAIPFFARVLNAFEIKYCVLHDLDIKSGMGANEKDIEKKRNEEIERISTSRIATFPVKLEETLGITQHLSDQFEALKYFEDHSKINTALEDKVKEVFELLENQ